MTKYRHTLVYKLDGVQLSAGDGEVEVVADLAAGFHATVSTAPDDYCFEGDRWIAMANLRLNAIFGQPGLGITQERLEDELEKIRESRRRIDAVLEKERERRRPLGPPPPPISEEHAALRERIAEAYRTVYPPEDPQGADLEKRIQEDFKLAGVAAKLISLVRKEEALLAEHGVEWQPYDFSLIRVDPPVD